MTTAVLATKLVLSTAAFLLLTYFGRFYDRRMTGVLLTFPILNVIGLLAASEPVRAAETICVVVIWNTVLFVAILTFLAAAKDGDPSANGDFRVGPRVLAWAALWLLGAGAVSLLLEFSPGPLWLWSLTLALVTGYVAVAWRGAGANAAGTSLRDWRKHRAQLRQFIDRDLGRRVALFVLAFAALSAVALSLDDSRWTGMAAAFPLPGIFALATLSATLRADALRQIRDTVLMGGLLVIPFNMLFAGLVPALPASPLGFLLFGCLWGMLFWLVAALLLFQTVPRIARMLDRLKRGA